MFEEATTLIEDQLKNNWSETLIDYDNVDFDPVIGTPFVRLQIEWTNTDVAGIGGRNRGEGYINVSIFYPANKGTIVVNEMADSLSAIFNKWDTGKLKFKVARTRRVGKQESWYRLDVIVPFTYDECG